MKVLTKEYSLKLQDIYTQEYIENTVDDLLEIDYEDAYPKDKNKYTEFVKHVYTEAKKYNLDNKQYAFSFIFAWHVIGDDFANDSEVFAMLSDMEISSQTKYDALNDMADKAIDKYETNKILKESSNVS